MNSFEEDKQRVQKLLDDCKKMSDSFKDLSAATLKKNPVLAKVVALSLLRFERDYRALGGRFASTVGSIPHEALQGLAKKIETGLEKIDPNEIVSGLQKTIPAFQKGLEDWLSKQK